MSTTVPEPPQPTDPMDPDTNPDTENDQPQR